MNIINDYLTTAPMLLIGALVVFIILDYLTGLMRALYERKGNSKTHYKGLIKKLGIILAVIVGAVADIVLSAGAPIFTTMIVLLFISNETLSIIENLGAMDVPLPKNLKEKLEQIRKDNE